MKHRMNQLTLVVDTVSKTHSNDLVGSTNFSSKVTTKRWLYTVNVCYPNKNLRGISTRETVV